MVPLSNLLAPFVDKAGKLLQPWQSFLQQFVQAPPKFLNITVTASPFSYQAVEPGYVYITGGTISLAVLSRGGFDLNVTGLKIVPVSINDVIKITYSVLPTVAFMPIYGNRTG